MFGFHLRSNLRGPTFHLFASTSRNSFSINQLAAEKCELRPIENVAVGPPERGNLRIDSVKNPDTDTVWPPGEKKELSRGK